MVPSHLRGPGVVRSAPTAEAPQPLWAADPATVMNVDRRVFLPIDIDADGPGFFTEGAPEEHLIDGSICFGLNHSRMTHHRDEVMGLSPERTAQSTLLIHRLLNGARHSLRPIKIAVCCCTYRRPQLLGHLIHCFEAQDYPHREMIILDDAGELEPATGPGWRIVSVKERAKSLGAKRNRLASMISTDADAIAPWDDDDLAMPWALSAVVAALRRADWARPSLVLVRRGDAFQPVKTSWREDGSDKAYHPSWGYMVAAFKAVGGYPEDVSVGEDLGLALKFRAAGFSEADPIAVGYEPYYAFGPWDNEHLSYAVEDYTRWPQRVPPTSGHVHVGPAPFSMARESIRGPVLARPWSGDWWENSMA
jgi:Glycosyl transferase family 2